MATIGGHAGLAVRTAEGGGHRLGRGRRRDAAHRAFHRHGDRLAAAGSSPASAGAWCSCLRWLSCRPGSTSAAGAWPRGSCRSGSSLALVHHRPGGAAHHRRRRRRRLALWPGTSSPPSPSWWACSPSPSSATGHHAADAQGAAPPRLAHQIDYKSVLRSRYACHLGVVYFMFGFAYMVYFTFFQKRLDGRPGTSAPGRRAHTSSSWECSASSAACIWGTISDRIGRGRAIAVMCLLQAVAAALFAWWPSTPGLVLSAVIFGLTVDRRPRHHRRRLRRPVRTGAGVGLSGLRHHLPGDRPGARSLSGAAAWPTPTARSSTRTSWRPASSWWARSWPTSSGRPAGGRPSAHARWSRRHRGGRGRHATDVRRRGGRVT